MIEFTCPGCLSRCVANEAFADMRARCVVCGAFIRIPAESGAVAFPLGPIPAGPLPTRALPSKPPAPSRPPRPAKGRQTTATEEEPVDLAGVEDESRAGVED